MGNKMNNKNRNKWRENRTEQDKQRMGRVTKGKNKSKSKSKSKTKTKTKSKSKSRGDLSVSGPWSCPCVSLLDASAKLIMVRGCLCFASQGNRASNFPAP